MDNKCKGQITIFKGQGQIRCGVPSLLVHLVLGRGPSLLIGPGTVVLHGTKESLVSLTPQPGWHWQTEVWAEGTDTSLFLPFKQWRLFSVDHLELREPYVRRLQNHEHIQLISHCKFTNWDPENVGYGHWATGWASVHWNMAGVGKLRLQNHMRLFHLSIVALLVWRKILIISIK